MALQSSGAISLNEIHIEAGGSSGTLCTINDSDIRGLISKGSGATMSFNEWYGASAWDLVLNGTGTYYSEFHQYQGLSTGDQLVTRATGNSSYPYMGVVREPSNGNNYYFMLQSVSVASTLNSYSTFQQSYDNSTWYTRNISSWTTYTYGTGPSGSGEVITYATPSGVSGSVGSYSHLASSSLYYRWT